ncbi:MAG: sigma-E processing peptidase SpoIIGA [Clostridia bacterium]|nr:sigma-E processing peptidase SpoIIGA [Clostridia bacterium]
MQQVIYVDVLIFLNTIITFIILLTTVEISGVSPKTFRLLTGSLLGGIFSLIILAPEMNVFFVFATRLAMSVSIVSVTFNIHKVKKFLRCLALFVVISFVFAGIVYFFESFSSSSFLQMNNSMVYFDVSFLSLVIMCGIVFAVIKILNKKLFIKTRTDMIYELEITFNEKTVSTLALYDSGNCVQDVYTGKPVIIVNAEEIRDLFDEKTFNSLFVDFSDEENTPGDIKLRFLPVKSISSSTLLPAFTAQKIIISDENIRKEILSPCIAVTVDELGENSYKALINQSIFV